MQILSEIEIFSDGAAEPNPGPGGWAFVVYENGVEIHHAFGTEAASTNNRMEMNGALQGLLWAAINFRGKKLTVFSDSQYVVKGCNEWRHNWKRTGWKRGEKAVANLDLWQELDEALNAFPATLRWIKGHSGIIGNERADELAFAAARVTRSDVPLMKLTATILPQNIDGLWQELDRERGTHEPKNAEIQEC